MVRRKRRRLSGAKLLAVTIMATVWGVGCTPTEKPVPPECRAGVLLEGSDLDGKLKRVQPPAQPPIRLLGQTSRLTGDPSSAGSRRAMPREIQAVREWETVQTSLGLRRRSHTWRTPIDRAGALVLEVERTSLESIDVTFVPTGRRLNEIEQFHRTLRLDLMRGDSATQEIEVELEPVLRGNWRDDQSSGATHFQVEIDASLPVAAIRRVEVQTKSARHEEPGAQVIAGPAGSLRPSLQLPSGFSWGVPIAASRDPRRLVFHVFAPVGEPRLSVQLSNSPLTRGLLVPSFAGWQRHELQIPAGASGELQLEVKGSGVALIGDPTIWGPAEQARPPDVIVYMVDTLLASRVGALGSSVPEVSPVMDFLVKRGLAFVRATSTSSWTKPAIASLMTGVYPHTHRVGTRNYTDRLSSRAPVLQERFREAGFRTISVSASPLGSTLSGLERGFDLAHPPARWEDELGPLGQPDARQVQEELLRFIDEDPSRPVFAYVHTLDVHEHHRPMFAEGAPTATPYDRAVRRQDDAIGALLRQYRARGREMIFVLLSDHGEGFGEYEIEPGHGYSLRQNQLHVPIVFYGPRWLPRGRLTEPASLVDVAPTLLDLFALAPLPRAQGRSLLPDRHEAPSAVYAERTWFLWDHRGPPLVGRISADGTKLVSGRSTPLLWNLHESPCEDQAHARSIDLDAVSELARFQREQSVAAQRWEAQYGESAPGRIDPDDIARLRALGYLQ